MSNEIRPLSGFRDILPGQMIPRQRALGKIREVYEGYGYQPLETPTIERQETLDGKYGEEGQTLTYRFKDRGNTDLALRYDLTVPLARVVAQHGEKIPMPFKRYQVGQVFRGESPQEGRYREFTQFDADEVGTTSPIADAEVVVMMADSMIALGADATIRVNNRRILDALVERAGVEEDPRGFIGIIDKAEKLGDTAALTEIRDKFSNMAANVTAEYLDLEGTTQERLRTLRSLLGNADGAEEGIDNLHTVFKLVQDGAGYSTDKVAFDQRIARGLNYYTGIVYETTLNDLPSIGSVSSGGRYDHLVQAMGGPDLPAVGTSIGVDRLLKGLDKLNASAERKTPSEIMVVNFGDDNAVDYVRIATELRRAGVPTEIHHDPARVKRQLRYANQVGVPYVLLAGPAELENDVVNLRDMKTGNQTEIPRSELTERIAQLKAQQAE